MGDIFDIVLLYQMYLNVIFFPSDESSSFFLSNIF